MNKYMVIVVQAHDGETPQGQLLNVTTIELMEDDPDRAVKRAKKLIKRKHYRVSQIIENYVKS
jgi:hypothetical protein